MIIDALFFVSIGFILGFAIMMTYYIYVVHPQTETLHDALTSQSSHCSSITAISDKIRCLENRIDIMNATITELDN